MKQITQNQQQNRKLQFNLKVRLKASGFEYPVVPTKAKAIEISAPRIFDYEKDIQKNFNCYFNSDLCDTVNVCGRHIQSEQIRYQTDRGRSTQKRDEDSRRTKELEKEV